jgi:hypothetical protein
MAAKSPLKKGEAGAALVAEATRAAADGSEGGEGRGPPEEVAGAELVADATCAAAAGGDDDGRTGLGLPPCQAVAEDPWGSLHQQPPRGAGGTRRRRRHSPFPRCA